MDALMAVPRSPSEDHGFVPINIRGYATKRHIRLSKLYLEAAEALANISRNAKSILTGLTRLVGNWV